MSFEDAFRAAFEEVAEKLAGNDPAPSISGRVYALELEVEGRPDDTLADVDEQFGRTLQDLMDAEEELREREEEDGDGVMLQ